MKVLNVHTRILQQPLDEITRLLETLSTDKDEIWPREKWPKMKFKDGLHLGSVGGHGPILYSVETYDPPSLIQFRFIEPKGFHGVHRFEMKRLSENQTEVGHTIDMVTTGRAMLLWVLGIRALHDALIEDAFDKIENHFSDQKKTTTWSPWVRLLRWCLG